MSGIQLLDIGDTDLVEKLLNDESLKANKNAVGGLKDMQSVLEFCQVLQISDKVCYFFTWKSQIAQDCIQYLI